MRLSVSNIAWSVDERLSAYAAMAEVGFTGLEIAPGLFFQAAEDPFAPSASIAAGALAEIEAVGLSLVSMQSLLFGVQGAALFNGKESRTILRDGMIRAINLAGRFGIPNLVFGAPRQRIVPEGMAKDTATEIARDMFLDLGDYAQAAGTCIAIEANPAGYGTNFLNTLDDAVSFVSHVAHPAIVMILDLGAMCMNGSWAETADWVTVEGHTLNHVHVSAPYLALAPEPGTESDLAQILSNLRFVGYSKAVSIEMARTERGVDEVIAAILRLKAASDQAEKILW